MADNTVYIAIWTHNYGEDVGVYRTEAGAELWRQEIAGTWWEAEMFDEPMPDDPVIAADIYFEIQGEGDNEYFCVYPKILED